MSESPPSSTVADLCQRIIEAADGSMFRYLSFFAAIHAAAFTAVASDSVGLPTYLSEISGGTREPVILLLPGLSLFMAGLCYVTARGLSDAAFAHEAAIERGRRLDGGLGRFFETVHGREFADEDGPFRSFLKGQGRILSRHHRAAIAAAGIGVLWSGFFLGLIWGFPGPVSESQGVFVKDFWWLLALSMLGLIAAGVGVGAVLQMLGHEVDFEEWMGSEEE